MSARRPVAGRDEERSHPLELSPEAVAEMITVATAGITRHLETLDAQPMHKNRGGRKLARRLREPLPETPTPFRELARKLFGEILPAGLNTGSPGYLAYIPGGGLVHAAVADLITMSVNRYVGVWLAAPGLVRIESNVIDWFGEIAGLPSATRGGVLTTGGSMANLIAVITARRVRYPKGFRKAVVYLSTESHHSLEKAAILAGIAPDRIRKVGADARGRMTARALEEAIGADRSRGLDPFFVAANAGTTNTGAVDDLGGIARVARAAGAWIHVDAAYGGFFRLTERGKKALRGIEHADSVTLDPHKGLFLPYGTGSLVVRDRRTLRAAHALSASYLPAMQKDDDLVDFCEISPELSREARGVRVWLPMRMHGAGAFRDALDEKLELARYAAKALAAHPNVELTHQPALSLLAFRCRPPRRASVSEGEALQRRVLRGVNARQRVLLTTALVEGRTVLRMCVLSFRTHKDRIDMALADISTSIAEALRE